MINAAVPKWLGWLGLAGTLMVSLHSHAAPQSLVILTSFSEAVSQRFGEAFEAAHPDVRVRFINKKTAAVLTHLEQQLKPRPDLVMASAIDAFDLLSEKQLLQPYTASNGEAQPYSSFGYSGYGLMWNRRYLEQRDLPAPADWDGLLDPVYRNHIGMSSPTRSGTTHVLVETILQQRGWEQGWGYLNRLAGNLATVTARSFGVRQGVIQQRFGIGLVIDFFAFSAQPAHAEIELTYPVGTSFLPVSAGIVKGGAQPGVARQYIDFLRSDRGQALLLEPEISRFPIRAAVLEAQPEHPLNSYQRQLEETLQYDRQEARRRYHLVNALFDQLITLRLPFIKQAWGEVAALEADPALAGQPRLQALLAAVKQRLSEVPFDESLLSNAALLAKFNRPLPGGGTSTAQRNQQSHWQRWASIQQADVNRTLGRIRSELKAIREQG
ncbi:ABC transporter substrate-binding protein [Motiliproteus sp. SC1-56]|uniref:ABC transporter substrate-binding protein n=1 Tax=Motiliproteus sp. SC1-56 TaxID=2799565 RepID=UPI001A8E6E37|nr:extracellular solute-binding protein [Motiliproteus sp. SC1-56]